MQKGRGRFIRFPALDRDRPLHEQLRRHIRDLLASGSISAGTRMPAQRLLARDLGVSRNTVAAAYDALISDGLLEGKPGAGTFVVSGLAAPRNKSARIRRPADPPASLPLKIGVVAVDLFPAATWRRLQEAAWRRTSAQQLAYGSEAGWSGFRQILAQRVAATRGLSCSADQVFVFPSQAAALRVAATVLARPGESAWVEDFGGKATSKALQALGLSVFAGPVDDQGLDVMACEANSPGAKFACVTPSLQFPTGVALSDQRRERLSAWAQRSEAWIIEDDSETEFFFEGVAPAPFASTLPERTIYLGSLNTLLLPSLQLAFAIVPEQLIDGMAAAVRAAGEPPNIPQQITAYDFMDGGHLADHVRRSKQVYQERRDALRLALEKRLKGYVVLADQPGGLHVLARLEQSADEADLVARAAIAGLTLQGVSAVSCRAQKAGLLLGFAAYTPAAIRSGVDRLSELIGEVE